MDQCVLVQASGVDNFLPFSWTYMYIALCTAQMCTTWFLLKMHVNFFLVAVYIAPNIPAALSAVCIINLKTRNR